jgi:hypothetical protein
VLEILNYLALEVAETLPVGVSAAPPGALLLRLVFDWDRMEAQGVSQRDAFAKLALAPETYGHEMLDMLQRMPTMAGAHLSPRSTAVRDLIPGMVLAEDLVRHNGVVILPRGFEIDRSLLDHVLTFAEDLEEETVKVFAR